METTLSKPASLRCDMHPPMSASLFCDHCNAFLCRLCAEVRPGGRMCVTCKNPCRQPAPEEFEELLARRNKAKANAQLVKDAAERLKQANERSKQDREARLKAEFAAKKAEWKQKTAANALPVTASGAVSVPQPAGGPSKFDDPLYKLGERGHLQVIGKAKSNMLWVAIITILLNGGVLALVCLGGMFVDTAETMNEAALARLDEAPKGLARLSIADRAKFEAQRDEMRAALERNMSVLESARWKAFGLKLALLAFVGVGAALLAFYFMCETKPRDATAWALYVYCGAVAADLILGLALGMGIAPLAIVFRGLMIYALYKGMVAGAALQTMRDEEAQWQASKAA